MSEFKCDHVRAGEVETYAEITGEKSGHRFILCEPCAANASQSGRFNPLHPTGYHIYISSDPELPKDKWERRTKTTIHDTQYRIKADTLEPDKEYYLYVTQINAYGLESPPSEVIKYESHDDFILGADEIG